LLLKQLIYKISDSQLENLKPTTLENTSKFAINRAIMSGRGKGGKGLGEHFTFWILSAPQTLLLITPLSACCYIFERKTSTNPNLILPLHLKHVSTLPRYLARPLQHSNNLVQKPPSAAERDGFVHNLSHLSAFWNLQLTELSNLQAREEPRGTGRS
jgi:hypothetical protein